MNPSCLPPINPVLACDYRYIFAQTGRVFQSLPKEAGFDVTKADWLKDQAKQILELSDQELEAVSGGKYSDTGCGNINPTNCSCKSTGCENP